MTETFHTYGGVDKIWERSSRMGGYNAETIARVRARERERAADLQRDFEEEARKREVAKRRAAARRAEKAFIRLARQRNIPDAVVRIIRVIAEHNRVAPRDIIGRNLARDVCQARAAAVYAIRSTATCRLSRSYPTIGHWFGRDHTTMLYAAKVHATRHGLPDITGLSSKAVDRKRQRPEQRTSFGA